MESWKQSGFVALVVVVAIVIGGGLQMWSLGHTPTRAPAVDACPVTQDICDFAGTVERQLQAHDYAAVTATSSGLQPALMDFVTRSLGGTPPHLVSIGCPLGASRGSCETGFALVFTILQSGDDSAGHGGILILRYERRPAGASLNMVNTIEEPDTRAAALFGGTGGGPCNLAGPAPDPGASGCAPGEFEPFSTGARSPSPGQSPTSVGAPGPAGAMPGARDVTMASDIGLPEGSSLLIGTTGYGHGGGGFFRLRKVWQLSSPGPTGSTEVIPWNGSPDPNGSSILGVAQSEDGTVLVDVALRRSRVGLHL